MTNIEKETVILFNEQDQAAQIETFNPRLLRQLRKVAACDGVSCAADEKGYGVYTVPKSMIKIHKPPKCNITEEKREIYRKRMEVLNAKRRNP